MGNKNSHIGGIEENDKIEQNKRAYILPYGLYNFITNNPFLT